MERVDADQYNLKFDHHFSENDYLFVRWSQGWEQVQLPPLMSPPANSQGFNNLYQREVVGSETHTFAANKVNEFRVGFVYTHEHQYILGPRLYEQYGIKGTVDSPTINGLPDFAITSFSPLGTVAPGTLSISAPGSSNFPAEKSGKVWEILDNFSWIHDRHSIKFGVDMSRVTLFVYATNSASPTITFNGSYTGNGFGDFLLGDVYNATTSQQQLDTFIQYVYNGYVQDDWKVSKKLTINYGIRYELPTPFSEEHNRQANFVLDSGPCYLQLITVAQDASCKAGIGPSQVRTDTNNFAPRLGFAYQATDKTVVRVGSGVFYGRDENLGVARRLEDNPPYVSAATFTGTTTTPTFQLQNGFPPNALSLAATGFNANTTVNSFPFNFPIPYVEQWNINVERQLNGNFVAQLGYTGSEAHKLPTVVFVNQPVPGPASVPVNSRRPYQGVGDIDFYAPVVDSTYNALIAKLQRRFSKGLSLLASYTYGHSIDNAESQNDSSDNKAQDARDLSANRGSSNFDVRHRFVLSGFYQLPFGKSAGFVNHFIREWQLTGIYSIQTGQPLTVTLSTDPSNTATAAHPNRIASGNLPADERSVNDWFDTSAFVKQTCVCFGNSGRMIIAAPGFEDLDLSLIRDFIIREDFRLQFRVESFNLMNHPNLGVPNTAIGNAKVGTITTTLNPERQNQFALKLYF